MAAGQAGGALHTMAVLQVYQADLLKDLDDGKGLSPEAVTELPRATDLALWATTQTAAAIGCAMAAMAATERHLWKNLANIREKENAPVSPSELFGTSVEAVVDKFRKARAQSAAYKRLIPRRPRSAPKTSGEPGLSVSVDYRQSQRQSFATWAPPPDLREVIEDQKSTPR